MNIMSHVRYKLFCSLVCHIIRFYFNVPAVLYFVTLASCDATEVCCKSVYISDFGERGREGNLQDLQMHLIAYRFNAFIQS